MRKAFTLVEMLVVLGIIAALGAMLAFALPGFIDRSRAANGASAIQGWLNYQRQRAQYEQAPRGLRFYVELLDPTDPLSPPVVQRAQAIEQPDDWTGGLEADPPPVDRLSPVPLLPDPNQEIVKLKILGPTDFGFRDAIKVGDYFELNGTGQVHRIVGMSATPNPVNPAAIDRIHLETPGLPNAITNPCRNYRIMRQPVVAGDEPMNLPTRVYIDLAVYATHSAAFTAKNAPPPKVVTDVAGGKYFDVLFSPSGQVLDQRGAMMILWVRMDEPNATEFDYNPTLLVVSTNSGAVAAYEPVKGAPLSKVK